MILRNWNGQDVSLYFDAHLSSGSRPGVYEIRSGFKFEIGLALSSPFLIDSGADSHGKISTHNLLIALSDGVDYVLHRVGGPSRLSDMPLHSFCLFSSRFDSFSQFFCLIGVNKELQKGRRSESRCEFYDVPIIRRFFLSIFGFLVGFCLSLRNLEGFDDQRRLIGAPLIGVSRLLNGVVRRFLLSINYTRAWILSWYRCKEP